jgi:histone H3/H4
MVLTNNQVVTIFQDLKVPYSNDAIQAIHDFKFGDSELAEKAIKAACYIAVSENRKVVTAKDVDRVLVEMRKPSAANQKLGEPYLNQPAMALDNQKEKIIRF